MQFYTTFVMKTPCKNENYAQCGVQILKIGYKGLLLSSIQLPWKLISYLDVGGLDVWNYICHQDW